MLFRNLTLTALVAACVAASGPAAAQDKIRTMSAGEALFYAPIYAAEKLGYFKQQNVDVQLQLANTGAVMIAALLSGDIDLAWGSSVNIPNARKQGGDIQLIGAIGVQHGVNLAASRKFADAHKFTAKSSYADRLAAFKGATVGITGPGSGTDQAVRYVASEAKIDADRDLTLVSLGGDTLAQLAALQTGRIDILAAAIPAPYIAVQQQNGEMMFNLVAGELPPLNGYFGSGISGKRDWLQKNSATVVRFMKALQMAVDAMHDPARTNQVRDMVKAFRFADTNTELYNSMWIDVVKATPAKLDVTRPMVQQLIDVNNATFKDKLESSLIDGSFDNQYNEKARN